MSIKVQWNYLPCYITCVFRYLRVKYEPSIFVHTVLRFKVDIYQEDQRTNIKWCLIDRLYVKTYMTYIMNLRFIGSCFPRARYRKYADRLKFRVASYVVVCTGIAAVIISQWKDITYDMNATCKNFTGGILVIRHIVLLAHLLNAQQSWTCSYLSR